MSPLVSPSTSLLLGVGGEGRAESWHQLIMTSSLDLGLWDSGVRFLRFWSQLGEAMCSVPQPSCGKREWEGRRVGLTASPGLRNGRKNRKADGAHDSSSAGYSAGRGRVGTWTILGARKGWAAKDRHKGSWEEVSEVY